MSEWANLGGVTVKQVGEPFFAPRSFMDDLAAMRASQRCIEDHCIESINYALAGEPMPFDRQLHWSGCHRWSVRGVTDDPALLVAEARWPRPEHWDDSIPGFFADWADDLAEWPRSRLYPPD